jgi:Ca2+-transporting ATPase
MAFIGIAVFLMVWAYSFWQSRDIVQSLLAGLTLAMSILPEEIPVAFTTFMALGSWKLMKQGVIIKRSSIVETLGSTTVICTDKTGTITENSMKLKALFDFKSNQVFDDKSFNKSELSQLIQFAMWSSEPVPFDPMEKTLHKVYEETQTSDQRKDFQMIHEYPLEGKPPMMTHIFENNSGERIIAAKGAPEAILEVSQLSEDKKENLRQQIQDFGKQGYRVLGVAKCDFEGNDFPEKQQDFKFEFLGFTVFYDPPKKTFNRFSKNIRCRNKSKSNYRR